MSLFKQKPKGYLGVDVGALGIKIVELQSQKGRARLTTYGYAEREATEADKPLLEDPKEAARIIEKVCKEAGCEVTQAIAALPSYKVVSSIVSVPFTEDKTAFKKLIEAQVVKITSTPVEELILDSKVLDDVSETEKKDEKSDKKTVKEAIDKKTVKNVRVLITGAPKKLVAQYVDIFKQSKLELVSLETESFALIRSLVGKDKSAILIIDMGASRTNLTVVEKGVPFVNRSVKIGGNELTNLIAKRLSLTLNEAEQTKRDLAQGGDEQALMPLLETSFATLINEIRYAFELYAADKNTDNKRVDKIILTGGSSSIPGLAKFISDKLNINVYIGDPWARVMYPQELRPVLDEIGSKFAVSIGLAMRDMEK